MKKLRLFSIVALGSTLILTSCHNHGNAARKKGGGTKRFTSMTGWKPKDSKGWFFSGKQQKTKGWRGMVYVEGGTFTMGEVKDDVMHDWNNTPRRMQVSSFFIGETEITNYEYREYTTWLKYVFPPNEADFKNIYTGALPDTLVWNNKLSRNDFSETYFRSPQFDYYPVVGISWLQATQYCDWLTDRANEKALMNKGVISKDLYSKEANAQGGNAFNLDKYKSNDPEMKPFINDKKMQAQIGIKTKNKRLLDVNKSATTGLVEKFRLPTEVEWEYAALGLKKDRNYNNYLGKKPEVEQLRGTKGRERGMFLENFKYGQGDYSGVAGWKNDGSPRTSDVRRYPTNDLGIYGMFGNVAEWTADVYRPIVDEELSDFNYFRGNALYQMTRNADGSLKKVDATNMKYDTLADGRLMYRQLPGKYERDKVADYSDYRDGDYQSSLDSYGRSNDSVKNFSMYNSKKFTFRVDKDGRVIMERDTNARTTQITNQIRVVKGGSWADTEYWLDPGQRRYKDQNKGYGWIGFRVAQDARDRISGRTKR